MKNIVLLGDSIRLQYQDKVRELLGDGYRVYAPDANCAYTKNTLWNIRFWISSFNLDRIDLIHWNNGIWDHHRTTDDAEPFCSLPEYIQLNERLYRQLAAYTGNLIWAATTPGGAGLKEDPNSLTFLCREEWNREIALYNSTLAGMLRAEGVGIDDLYAVIGADDAYIGGDGIHLSPAGIDAAAASVAGSVRQII